VTAAVEGVILSERSREGSSDQYAPTFDHCRDEDVAH